MRCSITPEGIGSPSPAKVGDGFDVIAFDLENTAGNEWGYVDVDLAAGTAYMEEKKNSSSFPFEHVDATIVNFEQVIGTEFGDDFIVSKEGVFGVGVNVNYTNVEILTVDGGAGDDRFFIQGNGDRMLFDLPGFGLSRLRSAGVGHAEWTRHCTYSDPDRFFSYRRSTHAKEADYGRLISAIRL